MREMITLQTLFMFFQLISRYKYPINTLKIPPTYLKLVLDWLEWIS